MVCDDFSSIIPMKEGRTVKDTDFGKKLLITPPMKNVKNILSKVQNIIGKSKVTRQDELIDTLNWIIRGCSNFHRHIVA